MGHTLHIFILSHTRTHKQPCTQARTDVYASVHVSDCIFIFSSFLFLASNFYFFFFLLPFFVPSLPPQSFSFPTSSLPFSTSFLSYLPIISLFLFPSSIPLSVPLLSLFPNSSQSFYSSVCFFFPPFLLFSLTTFLQPPPFFRFLTFIAAKEFASDITQSIPFSGSFGGKKINSGFIRFLSFNFAFSFFES